MQRFEQIITHFRDIFPLSIVIFLVLNVTSCELLEQPTTRPSLENNEPETYLSISSQSAIYAKLDSVVCGGAGVCDSVYTYYFDADSLPAGDYDTLRSAIQTVLVSTQTMTWWGEDSDGDIIGYYYKWAHDNDWTFTTKESETFIIPIRTSFGIFSFGVKAMDSDSLVDRTPAEIVLPVQNTRPGIAFRFRSNPLVPGATADITEKTFPTRTFLWNVTDDDGLETVDSIYYALDDTTSWVALGSSEKSITLSELTPGEHMFYLKVTDIAGAQSKVIHYPDSTDESTPNTWEVIEPAGDVLLVDDFPFDNSNNALAWYQSALDTIPGVGPDGYSTWEIGAMLPFSETDLSANLNYFKHVIWYTASTGPETYGDAANSINQFLQRGGNVLMNITEMHPSITSWFPHDSTDVVNSNGRLFSGTMVESGINSNLDLQISKLVPYRVSSFAINDTTTVDPVFGAVHALTPLYQMPAPSDVDPWIGQPIVAAEYDHSSDSNPGAGKAILFTIPIHDGSGPTMEGNGSAAKFISWLLLERFQP